MYLHYVLDEWFERDVQPRLRGEAYLIRYEDDFICAFQLGFTHYCGHSRTGKFKLKRKTAKKKYRGKIRDLKHWFRRQRTNPLPEVWKRLNAKLRGHYQYYGVNAIGPV